MYALSLYLIIDHKCCTNAMVSPIVMKENEFVIATVNCTVNFNESNTPLDHLLHICNDNFNRSFTLQEIIRQNATDLEANGIKALQSKSSSDNYFILSVNISTTIRVEQHICFKCCSNTNPPICQEAYWISLRDDGIIIL